MSKVVMPKNKSQLEDMLVEAFKEGMTFGYAVDHERASEDERVYTNRYRAFVQGKIKSMSESVNDEKTYTECMAESAKKTK